MAPDDPAQMAAKLAQLERELRELRLRLAVLEKKLAPRAENPSDQSAVREKVSYDWQA